jgi:hypothetical protein
VRRILGGLYERFRPFVFVGLPFFFSCLVLRAFQVSLVPRSPQLAERGPGGRYVYGKRVVGATSWSWLGLASLPLSSLSHQKKSFVATAAAAAAVLHMLVPKLNRHKRGGRSQQDC